MNYDFLYRDGNNYKWNISVSLDRKLELGDEITMEELGYTPEDFVYNFTGFNYGEDDHNLLEVVDILPDDYDVQIKLAA